MSTAPVTPFAPSWVTLLINLGANLGTAFIKNTQIGALINSGVATATAIIDAINAAKATGTATASNLTVPIFVAVLQEALQVAVSTGKIKDRKSVV